MRVALRWPERVGSLVLADSVGLGPEVSRLLAAVSLPGYGELAVRWGRTRVGAVQRALVRSPLLFARPDRMPAEWRTEQCRLARTPGFLEAALEAQRSVVAPWGQRELMLADLERLAVPVLVPWGERDRVVPVDHGRSAVSRLRRGRLSVLSGCGHLPQVERPDEFAAAVEDFLDEPVDPADG